MVPVVVVVRAIKTGTGSVRKTGAHITAFFDRHTNMGVGGGGGGGGGGGRMG